MSSDLVQVLLGRFNKERYKSYLNEHPTEFEAAIVLAKKNEQPQSWRAAWVLSHCVKKNDPRLVKHVNDFIDVIPVVENGHQRTLLKLLEHFDLNDEQEGKLFDHCMGLWEDIAIMPSARITALDFVLKTVKKYPELKNEIMHLMTEDYIQTLSPGIQNSFKRMLKEATKD